MDQSFEKAKQQEFKNILHELAKEILPPGKKRSEYIVRLENFYYLSNGTYFKHFYSDIYIVMSEINSDIDNGESVDILSENVKILRRRYEPRRVDANGDPINITDYLKKLFDHVSLEQARFTHIKTIVRTETNNLPLDELSSKTEVIQKSVIDFSDKFEKLKEQSDDVGKKYQNLKEELEDSKNQYISILGIFSSVVLSFTAGIAFSTSVLENIDKVSTYRLIFVSCIIGLVLLNIIFALFYYIGTLTGKEGKVKPIFIANIVFIIIMLLTILAWDSGAIEKRNKRYENISSGNETVATTQTYSKTSD